MSLRARGLCRELNAGGGVQPIDCQRGAVSVDAGHAGVILGTRSYHIAIKLLPYLDQIQKYGNKLQYGNPNKTIWQPFSLP